MTAQPRTRDENEPDPTPRYRAILANASAIARTLGHTYVGAEHLFLAIINDADAVPTQVLADTVNPAEVDAALRAVMESHGYTTPTRKILVRPGSAERGS